MRGVPAHMQVLSPRQVSSVEYLPAHEVSQVPVTVLTWQPPLFCWLVAQTVLFSWLHGSMHDFVPPASMSSHDLSLAHWSIWPAEYLRLHWILHAPDCHRQMLLSLQAAWVAALAQVATQPPPPPPP